MLSLFSLSTMISGAGWITFSPIFNLTETLYGVQLITINYLSLSFMLFYLPMNFPSTYILDKYGLRIGICIGIVFTTVGLWMRCLVNSSFWWVVMG